MQGLRTSGDYVKKVCEQIRWRRAHGSISKELIDHIEDRKCAYMRKGETQEIAEEKAVLDMGDAVTVGQQLDATHRPKPEWSIVIILSICIIAGLIIQFITSYCSGGGSGAEYIGAFKESLIALPIGIAAFLAIYFADYTLMVRTPVFNFILLVIICNIINSSGVFAAWAGRSCILYMSFIICSMYAVMVYKKRNSGYLGILELGMLAGLALITFAFNDNYMACFTFAVSGLVIITYAVIKNWFLVEKWKALVLIYLPTTMVGVYVAFGTQSYLSLRGRGIILWNLGEADRYGSNYVQYVIRDTLLPGAKLLGDNTTVLLNGAKISVQSVLPNWWSEYSLAYLTYRFGYICGILLVAVIIFLLVKMAVSTFRQSSLIGFTVCLSVTIQLFVQAVFYVLSNLGFIQAFAGPLPFISYGSMAFVVNMFLMGLFMSACRNKSVVHDASISVKKKRICDILSYKE